MKLVFANHVLKMNKLSFPCYIAPIMTCKIFNFQ